MSAKVLKLKLEKISVVTVLLGGSDVFDSKFAFMIGKNLIYQVFSYEMSYELNGRTSILVISHLYV